MSKIYHWEFGKKKSIVGNIDLVKSSTSIKDKLKPYNSLSNDLNNLDEYISANVDNSKIKSDLTFFFKLKIRQVLDATTRRFCTCRYSAKGFEFSFVNIGGYKPHLFLGDGVNYINSVGDSSPEIKINKILNLTWKINKSSNSSSLYINNTFVYTWDLSIVSGNYDAPALMLFGTHFQNTTFGNYEIYECAIFDEILSYFQYQNKKYAVIKSIQQGI